jgi:hypothetical protein
MNNFEKIKSMDIDEMINFINRLRTSYCQYKEHNFNCIGCFISELCDLPMSKTRQWLESEVRE